MHKIMSERERIELLMKCYELAPSQFADKTGIQRASVSHILSGRNKPSLEVMQKIYEAFPELDAKWLMFGTGEAPVRGSSERVGARTAENNLFSAGFSEREPEVPEQPVRQPALVSYTPDSLEKQPEAVHSSVSASPKPQSHPKQPKKVQPRQNVQAAAVPARRIKEIRVFYTDGTYETLFPEKP